jgi:hypothetical protein
MNGSRSMAAYWSLQLTISVAPTPTRQFREQAHDKRLRPECDALNAVWAADDRTGPAFDVPKQPLADRLEIAGEVELCDRLAVATLRPQLLVGL